MEFLYNPWVVGIGGGILSGLIVFLVTRYFLSKREDKEYLQKVKAVNRELITSIKPGIAESEIPKLEVVEALIQSTARKFGVETTHVYDIDEIVNDLIKEVMDSSFISAKDKDEFCNMILTLKKAKDEKIKTKNLVGFIRGEKSLTNMEEYRKRVNQWTSLTFAIMVTTLSISLTLIFQFELNTNLDIEFIPIIVGGITIVAFMLVLLFKDASKFIEFFENLLKKKSTSKKDQQDLKKEKPHNKAN